MRLSEPTCCPCKHPWFCPEVAQGCIPFSTFCPRPSSRLWCGVGWCWGIGCSGCRNQGGYAASWSLDCLCGRPLPGPVCPRSGCKLCHDMGGTRRLYLQMSAIYSSPGAVHSRHAFIWCHLTKSTATRPLLTYELL